MRYILFTLITLVLFSCAPKVKRYVYVKEYKALAAEEEIQILGEYDKRPPMKNRVAFIKVKDSGFTTDCGYDLMMGLALTEARKLGANVLKIREHRKPGEYGTCDQIFADLYKLENKDLSEFRVVEPLDSAATYAKLILYRPDGTHFSAGYSIFFNREILTTIKGLSATEIKLQSLGENKISAVSPNREGIYLNFEKGRTYYIRCTLEQGVLADNLKLELVSYAQGAHEVAQLLKKKP